MLIRLREFGSLLNTSIVLSIIGDMLVDTKIHLLVYACETV
jgi:hypothetical protein